MKFLLVISGVVVLAVAAPSKEADALYKIDFDALLSNDKERQATFDCLLGKSPCGDKQEFKNNVEHVIKSTCADCTPEQKEKYDRVLKNMHDKYEAEFNEFMKNLYAEKKN